MKTLLKMSVLAFAFAAFGSVGCGSNTTDGDASYNYDVTTGPTVYPMSDGTYCFDILTVSGVSDGCGLAVDTLVGYALPGTYVASTGQFTLGTEGSLGTGLINNNQATLLRKGDPSDGAGCAWHQEDTTNLTMTGQNMFTVSVVETESNFLPASCAPTAASTTCTSMWTWTMGINAARTPPACK
jgi:hypothetical protein